MTASRSQEATESARSKGPGEKAEAAGAKDPKQKEDRLLMCNWSDSTDHRTAMALAVARRRARLLLDGLLLTSP